MRYLLDTNIVIKLTMNTNAALRHRASRCDEGDLATSAIVFAEIAHGSFNDKPPAMKQLMAFTEEVPVLPFDRQAALAYASLPFQRGRFDRLIAAHALALGLTIITNNRRDFEDVPGLTVEDWTQPL